MELADPQRIDGHPPADGIPGPGAEDGGNDEQRDAGAGAAADEHVRGDVEQAHDDREDEGRPDHGAASGARFGTVTRRRSRA